VTGLRFTEPQRSEASQGMQCGVSITAIRTVQHLSGKVGGHAVQPVVALSHEQPPLCSKVANSTGMHRWGFRIRSASFGAGLAPVQSRRRGFDAWVSCSAA
jgi:hypothetical protein